MIAAWLSLAAGWALTHAWSVVLLITLLTLAVIWLIVVPLIDAPEGAHRRPPVHRRALTKTSRAICPPRWRAGMTRAARRIPEAVRRAPGHINASPPVVPGSGEAPGLSAAGGSPASARPGTTELRHEPGLTAEDTATMTWLRSMRGLRHPGWNTLELRARLAMLRTLIASGRGAPGHTAPSPHGEPGHPAGGQAPIRGDAQGRAGGCAPQDDSRPAARADLTGSLSPRPPMERPGLVSAPPDPGTPVPAFLASPPPHDVALWQPKRFPTAADLAVWATPLADPSDTLTIRLPDFWTGA